MNGNCELTETENVIVLRKLRSSYGIITDERYFYVGYFATATDT